MNMFKPCEHTLGDLHLSGFIKATPLNAHTYVVFEQIPAPSGWLSCYYCNVYVSRGQSSVGGGAGYYPWNPGFGHPSQAQGNGCPEGYHYSRVFRRCIKDLSQHPPPQ
ncbi:hypothetical protein Fcan01_26985 [Folsomia candida]|uniref:Uncharacterized protein n=1 Tax=Folsomia candida TaxID=158441 RepID=A0A226CZR4_FOLCA|nr:hypothetical protein Fcan01_26985 [Folsomia candida]